MLPKVCVGYELLSHLPKIIEFYMHSHVTVKNFSWLHFRATL